MPDNIEWDNPRNWFFYLDQPDEDCWAVQISLSANENAPFRTLTMTRKYRIRPLKALQLVTWSLLNNDGILASAALDNHLRRDKQFSKQYGYKLFDKQYAYVKVAWMGETPAKQTNTCGGFYYDSLNHCCLYLKAYDRRNNEYAQRKISPQ